MTLLFKFRRQFSESRKLTANDQPSIIRSGPHHPPPEGRNDKELQTDKWVEEIKDKMEERDIAVQTDEFER